MQRRNSQTNRKPPRLVKEETVIKHAPEKPKPSWGYTTKKEGFLYPAKIPATQEYVEYVESQVLQTRNWGRYMRHPQGGDVNFTQVTCFPPFDIIRVAEIHFPDGRIWSSSKRTFI